jgi:uncharacterized protein YbjQ (UPF0145 family)
MTDAVRDSILVATTAAIEGHPVQWYLGIVSGDALMGREALSEALEGLGEGAVRCEVCTQAIDLRQARDAALLAMLREAAERGANAVLGVGFAQEPIELGERGVGLVVTASGTAVRI